MTITEIIAYLKALSIEERISIIQELLKTIKSEFLTDVSISETRLTKRTLTPEALFTEFASQGKTIHSSPTVEHNEPVMGAGGAIPRVS